KVLFSEIPIGLSSGGGLREQLSSLSSVDAWALLNIDLSPIEIYGGDVIDLLVERAVECQEVRSLSILMSCAGGNYALPLSDALRRVSLVIDLDSPWD